MSNEFPVPDAASRTPSPATPPARRSPGAEGKAPEAGQRECGQGHSKPGPRVGARTRKGSSATRPTATPGPRTRAHAATMGSLPSAAAVSRSRCRTVMAVPCRSVCPRRGVRSATSRRPRPGGSASRARPLSSVPASSAATTPAHPMPTRSGRHRLRMVDQLADTRRQFRPQLLRKAVAHSLQHQQLRVGDGRRRGVAAADVADDVGGAVHDQGGHPQGPQAFGAVAGGQYREALALDAKGS